MITVNNKFFNQQWGLKLINVEKAWDLLNGSRALTGTSTENAFGDPNINIAIVDQGVETNNNLSTHKSFSGQTTNGKTKFLKNIALDHPSLPSFDFKDYLTGSHGMEVSGIVAAKAQVNNLTYYNGEGVVGTAPNCSFYAITTEKDVQFKLLSMFALAGLEFTSPKQEVLNDAYNITTDRIVMSPLNKMRGTTDAGKNLSFFLNNTYADIFNLSIKALVNPSLTTENYSKIIFNELSFFGRKGRGCISIVGAGNDGLDIEPSTNQFLNEFAYSNKPLIVGAISVDNTYNWLTNNPPANARKSNYSNYGSRIDICAPGGGENPALPQALGLQDKNLIFSTTVRGAGNICSNSPLKISLKTKIKAIEFSPINHDYYASIELELDNTNGVFEGQTIIIGDFNALNSYEIYQVASVNTRNKITIEQVKKVTYSNLIDSSMLGTKSILEFSPMFTKIVSISSNRSFNVENIKGAFSSSAARDKIYIGALGDGSVGAYTNIHSINPITNEIVLTSNKAFNIGDYVVFPRKSSKILSGNTNGSKKIRVQNIEGFFPGGFIEIDESDMYSNITTIDVNTKTINLRDPLVYSIQTSGDKYVKNAAAGDMTEKFNGTSAATPFVSGVAALVLSANENLSAAEVKHILKETASSSNTISNINTPTLTIPSYSLNSDGYMHNTHYGTGLVDAGAAVDLALKWHTSTTLQKPKMEIADKLNANVIEKVALNSAVISPDIWVKPISDPNPTTPPSGTQLFNTITTTDNQIISVRVRNTGDRKSFKECDLRVLVAFTDEDNPAFPFPEQWYDYNPNTAVTPSDNKPCVKLLAVKEIPVIAPKSETIIQIPWNDITAFWEDNNPLPTAGGTLVPGGKRKRAYILAHIAPFDGLFDMNNSDPTNPINLSLANIRNNKQLSCKEIIVTHNGVNNRTAYIPGNKLNITVGTNNIEKTFDLSVENVLASELDGLKIKASKKNRSDQATEEVIYQKTGAIWALESGNPDWIAFETPKESMSVHNDYKNVIFPHKLTINEEEEEIKLEIINA